MVVEAVDYLGRFSNNDENGWPKAILVLCLFSRFPMDNVISVFIQVVYR